MNKIPHLIDVYRPQGVVELQPLVPFESSHEAIRELLLMGQRHNCESVFLGLKNHRKDDFTISYSGNGISFGVELQLRRRSREKLNIFARELFEFTVEIGSKVYLAKDELLPIDLFQKMYPEYQQFIKIKRQLDPESLFVSDIYRRLFSPSD